MYTVFDVGRYFMNRTIENHVYEKDFENVETI